MESCSVWVPSVGRGVRCMPSNPDPRRLMGPREPRRSRGSRFTALQPPDESLSDGSTAGAQYYQAMQPIDSLRQACSSACCGSACKSQMGLQHASELASVQPAPATKSSCTESLQKSHAVQLGQCGWSPLGTAPPALAAEAAPLGEQPAPLRLQAAPLRQQRLPCQALPPGRGPSRLPPPLL